MQYATQAPPDLEQRTMRKVTWKLIPFLCICFMAAFMDRVNVGFAKQQMVVDLGFSTAVYGFGAGVFFIGYFLFEVPSNLIMVKLGARLWIARIMVVWGLVSMCMAFVHSATGFYFLRFLLGASEAGFFPGVILYLTYWFPPAYRSRTVALFMTAAVLSNVIGGPLSGVLLELDGVLGIRGWKWLFVTEAFPSIVLGIVVFFKLPSGPEQAKWLFQDERDWLVARLLGDKKQTVGERDPSFLQTLSDPRVLLLCAVYFANVIGGYGLDFFLPTLIKRAFPGASSALVGVLSAIPPLFAIFAMMLHGRSSDRRGERRWHVATALWWAAFGLLLASLPVPAVLALAALSLAVSGRWSTIAPFWGLSTAFLSGRAAAGAIALINAVGNLGGFAGPYLMGWLKDQTGDYIVGLRILAGAMFCGGLLALLVRPSRGPRIEIRAAGAGVASSSVA
ncbi:MAG TPA: MFS transporter [Polyangiaceae bacterium]|jgi:ACS family tartrate transporter-like MFS transporter|nr:MFS transporter [Polyangiaceae bacterium]